MNSPSVDIKDMIEGIVDLSLTYGVNLFIGLEPPEPSNCVTVFDTPGFPDDLTFDKDEKYERPSVQILVRNKIYASAWAMIRDIKDFLHGYGHITMNGAYYSVIMSAGAPAMLDHDERGRVHFVWNIDMQRR